MAQKEVKMLSYFSVVRPNYPAMEIDDKTVIIVEDDGSQYAIGNDAPKFDPNSGRITGGSLKDKHYCRLIKALVAKGLGGGDFTLSVGMSAAANQIEKFRENRGATTLNREDLTKLKQVLSKIQFRVGSSIAPIQTCCVTLKEKPVPVLYETEAVMKIMPDYAKTMMLFQIGGGDWQSLISIDGEIQHQTHTRAAGLNGAIDLLGIELGLGKKESINAWMTNKKPSRALEGTEEDCVSEKTRAIRQHIVTQLPTLLASTEGYQDRIRAIVVTGGAVHDELFIELLKSEIPSDYHVYSVNDMELMVPGGKKVMDASYGCAYGIFSSGCDIALDVGNNYLKGVFQYD